MTFRLSEGIIITMKGNLKIKFLLQELGKDPRKQLNTVFLLISIIPILTIVYLFYGNMAILRSLAPESLRVYILIGVIMILGYATGYGMIQDIMNKTITYAAKAKKADELKSKFAISLAHDLKSPLSVIKTNISAMKSGYHGDLSAPQKDCVSVCDEVSDRMNSMIMELIDTYKFEAREATLNLSRFDLCGIVEEQVRELEPIARLKGITLTLERCKQGLLINADPDKITRVVNNILNNSIKYTPDKGRVMVRLAAAAGFARMEFMNTGKPIPEDMLEKIFDKFERLDTSVEGHGLGLAIAKDIIELHNGKIWASSAPGKPNCFTVSLALSGTQERGKVSGNDVLIIEDNKEFALSIKNALARKGYRISVSYDAASGIKLASSNEPSLIILDLGLPGVDDYFVLQSLKKMPETADIPVIVSTGNITQGLEAKVRGMGAEDFIQKPYDIEKLAGKIQALLNLSR